MNRRTGPIHGSQDPDLGASVGQTLVRQRESRASTQGESEPKQCRELLHASLELQGFLLEFRCPQIRHVQAHHDLRCPAEPPAGRRARDPEIPGDGPVSGALDEIPKPVVVALLQAPRGRHGMIIRRSLTPLNYSRTLRPSVDVRRSPQWRQLAPEGAECPWRQLRCVWR
jgi:hypothetical protein